MGINLGFFLTRLFSPTPRGRVAGFCSYPQIPKSLRRRRHVLVSTSAAARRVSLRSSPLPRLVRAPDDPPPLHSPPSRRPEKPGARPPPSVSGLLADADRRLRSLLQLEFLLWRSMISSCPICDKQVLTAELEWHANSHFEDEVVQTDMELAQQVAVAELSTSLMGAPEHFVESFNSDSHAQGASSSISMCSSPYGKVLDEQISCLVGAQLRSKVQHIGGGVMNLLRSCLETEGGSSTSIISGHVDHHQSLSSEDKGWGCGWRNIQMLSSHLLRQRPEARGVLFGGCGFVPDIPSLQRWLEIAWDKDFDIVGSSHFHNKVYGGKKWIGTTECVTLLRSFGLRARLVDFDSTESSDPHNKSVKRVHGPMDKFLIKTNSSPRSSSSQLCQEDAESTRGQQVLVDWVWNYFASNRVDILTGSQKVIVSDKTPLYFQHHGHSRTIVGIQKQKGYRGSPDRHNLLVLDPGHRTADLERSLTDKKGWQRLVKRGVHTLQKPQYQLCYVDPGIASSEEIEQLKTIDSILIRF